jgi:alkanesulfonate monooxygenase SsuD/methylene tetrahydromethanopterin reductase-like flavin-dependent oxidoreductase (luciferase family)
VLLEAGCFIELTRRSGLSLAELGQRYGAGRTTSGFTGTPGAVADRMQEWFDAGACASTRRVLR